MNGGNRAEGQQGIRNLSKITAHLRNGDAAAAVKTAVDLQDGSKVIDYVSFVLERVGTSAIKELAGNVPLQLLILISTTLRDHVARHGEVGREDGDFVRRNLSWCETIIPLVSS